MRRTAQEMPAIEVADLHHTYGASRGLLNRRTGPTQEALAGVTFAVRQGELFGLLGPNGAGKTTLAKILASILLPTSGTVRILGVDVVRNAARCRSRLGIVFGGERGLYWRLSGRSNLEYFAALYLVPPPLARRRIALVLEMVGLHGRATERVERYSRGMRQRLHIARALVHDPDVLIMDEPTIGLDPVAARELRGIIRALRDQGKTIFLTTHYMYEADELCDQVAIIHRGRLLVCDTPAAVKQTVQDLAVIEVEFLDDPAAIVERLRLLPAVTAVEVSARQGAYVVQIQSVAGARILPQVLTCADGARLGKVMARDPTLEDAYVRLVGAGGYVV